MRENSKYLYFYHFNNVQQNTLFWRENSNFFNLSIFDVRMHYLGVKIQTFIHISNTSIHNVHIKMHY